MPFSDELAEINQTYFFREFTYSNTLFKHRAESGNPRTEVELADALIWIGDELIAYQLKERFAAPDTSTDKEIKWFKKEILYKGTKQIRDTRRYIAEHEVISLQNHRNHSFDLRTHNIRKIHQLVVFKPNDLLPEELGMKKFHVSSTVGIIHIINSSDYLGIVQTLLTPAEFMDYLTHRENLIEKWGNFLNEIPEQCLVGHYVSGAEVDREPNYSDLALLTMLDHELEEWDISGIIKVYADRIIRTENDTDYYGIVEIIAKLKRNELKLFKLRFLKAKDDAFADRSVKPYRFTVPRLNTGFLFIPLPQSEMSTKLDTLQAFTALNKHDQKLDKCIGLVFVRDTDGYFFVDWCLFQWPWEADESADKVIKENNPFRAVKEEMSNTYQFHQQEK